MRIFKTENRKQTVILQRMYAALCAYLFFFLIGFYGIRHGLMKISFQTYICSFSLIFLVQFVFLYLVRSGKYEHWSDSDFMFYQILFGYFVLAFFLLNAEWSAVITLVNASMLGLLFAAFALKRTHIFILLSIPLLTFTFVAIREYFQGGLVGKVPLAVLQWGVTLFMLIFFSFMAEYMSALRAKIHASRNQLVHQKSELEVAHREMKSLLRQMADKAVTDELTGLYNRHQFSETLHAQMSVAHGTNNPLGILIMDVDHFKNVNDTYGHLNGDKVLKVFKKIPENCLRKSDFIARYGGEEFVIILPNSDVEKVKEISERVRKFVETQNFDDIDAGFSITVSIGATHYYQRETADDLMDRSDKALYQAKENGRNQVVYIE